MSQSPARAALAAHQEKIAAALAVCGDVRRPLFEVRDRLDSARADLREAEADLTRAQTAETNAVIAGADTKRQAVEVAKTQATAERCRRVVAALEAKATGLEDELRRAEETAKAITADMQPLLDALIEEIAEDLLGNVVKTRKAAARAEAAFRTLSVTCHQKHWLKLVERLNEKFRLTPAPSWTEKDSPDWLAFLAKLSADASTRTPAVLS